MSKIETNNDEYDEYEPVISEIVNSKDNVNILIDKLIALLIKTQDNGKDFNETKHLIHKCITLSSQSIDDIFSWLKVNQNEPKYLFLLGFFYYNKFVLEEYNNKGFISFYNAASDNYPIAQVYLSICYKEGFGTEIDNNLAFY